VFELFPKYEELYPKYEGDTRNIKKYLWRCKKTYGGARINSHMFRGRERECTARGRDQLKAGPQK